MCIRDSSQETPYSLISLIPHRCLAVEVMVRSQSRHCYYLQIMISGTSCYFFFGRFSFFFLIRYSWQRYLGLICIQLCGTYNGHDPSYAVPQQLYSGPDTVSYTHLDVYKRQPQEGQKR